MSENSKLVSIVMPVHNGGAYLQQAVRSILSQTHTDIELLLVDDHSDDGARDLADPGSLSVPLVPPFAPINRFTLPAMNVLLHHLQGRRAKSSDHYQKILFPLDGIAHWNRMYGPRGFQQYQCVLPTDTAADALAELLALIRQHRQGSFLSVLKICGAANSPGLLSFPMPGISLALDFPQNPALAELLATMDRCVAQAGGRLYPAKDAHMSAQVFQQGFPAWQQLEQLRDPALLSRFWQRVTQDNGVEV